MPRKTALQIKITFYPNPEVPKDIIYYYIFMFNLKDLNFDQNRNIQEYQCESHRQIVPIGRSLQEYKEIQGAILKQHTDSSIFPKITLVTNAELCEQILQMKEQNGCLGQIEEVYLCYKEQNQQTEDLLNRYNLINRDTHNIDTLIQRSAKNFVNLHYSKQILDNFMMIRDKQCKRSSYLMNIRGNGSIRMKQTQYEEYKEKFQKYLSQYLSLKDYETSKQYTKIKNDFQNVLKLYQQDQLQTFSQEMLNLYQGNVFYEILNKGLMGFTKESFAWTSLALPYLLLFKAIKYKYSRFCISKQEVQKFFGQKRQVTLWRGGRINESEYSRLKESLPYEPFLEASSFVSTSLNRKIVQQRFLDLKGSNNSCLMKITLKRPTNEEELQNFSFIYHSFAMMKDQREQEILFNALTIFRLVGISQQQHQVQLKSDHPTRKRTKKVKVPILQLRVVDIQQDIKLYFDNKSFLSAYEKSTIHHYLLTIDSMKDYRNWDIGDSLRFSGQLKDAKQYYTHRLLKIENTQALSQDQALELKRSYHETCDKLSDICFNMNLAKESMMYGQLSINAYSLIEKLDKSRSFKYKQEYMNKKLQKYTFILQMYNRVSEAREAIIQRIDYYKRQMQQHKHLRLVYMFYMAKLYVNLGIIWLRQGRYEKAQKYLQQSRQKIQMIKKQIDYQGLKTQNFYFRFIIYFVFSKVARNQVKNMQDFFKIKRAENIAQATFIFGGQLKFEQVHLDAEKLKIDMLKYIQDYKRLGVLSQQGMSNESLLTGVENRFSEHETAIKLKPDIAAMQEQIQRSIIEGEQSQLQKKSNQIYDLIIQAAEKSVEQMLEDDVKIVNLKEELLQDRLKDWKNTDQNQKASALSIKQDFERHLLKLKQVQNAYLQKGRMLNLNSSEKEQYMQYLRSSRAHIEAYLRDMREFYLYHPTLESINKSLERQSCNELEGDQEQANAQLERIIQATKDKENFLLQSLEAFLRCVRLRYSIADIDFLNCLERKIQGSLKGFQIKRMQKQMIKECQLKLQQATSLIKSYQMRPQRSRREIAAASQSELYLIRRQAQRGQTIKQIEMDQNFQKRIIELDIYVDLWKLKCCIFQYNHEIIDLRKDSQRAIKSGFKIIAEKIRSLQDRSKKRVFQSYFNEIKGLYKFKCFEYFTGYQQLTRSFTQSRQFNELQRDFNILTKIFFMYYRDKWVRLDKLMEKMKDSENFARIYPFYWRLCLAKYYQNKKKNNFCLYEVKKCLENMELSMNQSIGKDKYLLQRHQIIDQFEYRICLNKDLKTQQPIQQSDPELKNRISNATAQTGMVNSNTQDQQNPSCLPSNKELISVIIFSKQDFKADQSEQELFQAFQKESEKQQLRLKQKRQKQQKQNRQRQERQNRQRQEMEMRQRQKTQQRQIQEQNFKQQSVQNQPNRFQQNSMTHYRYSSRLELQGNVLRLNNNPQNISQNINKDENFDVNFNINVLQKFATKSLRKQQKSFKLRSTKMPTQQSVHDVKFSKRNKTNQKLELFNSKQYNNPRYYYKEIEAKICDQRTPYRTDMNLNNLPGIHKKTTGTSRVSMNKTVISRK